MKWAVYFFLKQNSLLACWDKPGDMPKFSEFSVITDKNETLDFESIKVGTRKLVDLWQPGDTLITEVGGPSYAICLQAIDRGLEVYRYHSYTLTQLAIERGIERGGVHGENRWLRLGLMAELAESNPELLYKMYDVDDATAAVTSLIDEYVSTQDELRKRAQQRQQMRKMNLLWMPKRGRYQEAIVKLLACDTDIKFYLALERKILNGVVVELPNIPIWTEFMRDIYGIGPSIAGRLIAEIRDIKRFPTLGGFRAMCGLRTKNGKMVRFEPGKVEDGTKRITYNKKLRLALYYFGDQIVRGGEKNPYNSLFKEWLAYYTERDGTTLPYLHIRNRARRAAFSAFANHLWRAWWRIEEARGTVLPETVRRKLQTVDPTHPNEQVEIDLDEEDVDSLETDLTRPENPFGQIVSNERLFQ